MIHALTGWFSKKKTIFYLLTIFILLSFSIMADLTYQGQTYIDTANPVSYGISVPRSTPTNFQFLNNYVSSINVQGYMIQAGDEGVNAYNNNLDGEILQGNMFDWKGDFAGLGTAMTITHGVFTGCNIDVEIKHNYLSRVPMGIIRKSASNMVNNSGGVSYNILKTFNVGGVVKGMSGVKWYNNTFYQDRPTYSNTDPTAGTWRGAIDVYANTDVTPVSNAYGTKIKNNIFYSKYKTYAINVMDAGSMTDFECDYNVYWVEEGDHTPVFKAGGVHKSWDQWRAMGYDAHSVVMNPDFIDLVDFVPRNRLDYGTNLGPEWETGLSTAAKWVVGTPPATTIQNGTWQVGARVYAASTPVVLPTVTVTTAASSITQTTAVSGGTITSDGGAPITARGVCWDQSGGPALDNPHTTDGTGTGTFTSNITGLSAGIKYYVKAYATNSAGTGYGPRIEFTTQSAAGVPTVTTTAITTITETAATGGGTVTSDGGSVVLERGVCWSTSTNPTTANNKQASGTGTGVFTAAITGLTPGTTYYVRAYARNAIGTSYGANVSFTSVAFVPVSPYYVSTTGNDTTGNGTITKPWFSLNKAWQYVKPGETIYMRGGTYLYTTSQILTGKNGTSGNYIKIHAYADETPVISKHSSFTYTSSYNGIYFSGNYIHWKGIDVTGFTQETAANYVAMRVFNTSYSIFEKMNVHHNCLGFYLMESGGGISTQNLILNSDFHHNYDPLTSSAAGQYGNADGLAIAYIANTSSYNIVRGCRFYNNSDDGFDMWMNEGFVLIENSWAFKNGYREDGITHGGDGNGFKLGQIDASKNNSNVKRKLVNCLAVENYNMGFTQNSVDPQILTCELYNNVAYKNVNGAGFQFNWAAQGTTNSILRNNISFENGSAAALLDSWITNDHNSWNAGFTLTSADFVNLDTSELLRERQADGSLPEVSVLHLAQGSDLIEKGVDVGLPFNGNYPDLGAFETNYPVIPVSPYFVAPNGSDVSGNGTIEKPWFTINKAWSYAKPGETVYMRGGTYYYNETQNVTVKNGTPGNLIKLHAYQNEDVIIRPSSTYTATTGVYVRGHYLHLKGLEISYYEQKTPDKWYNGIVAYSSNNCIFEQLDVHHNGFGFSIGGTSNNNLVLNSDFHHNWDPITAITTNRPYGGSDGLTIRVSDPSTVNIVRGCRMWNNSDDGFDGWANSGMLIFEDCWSFNNGYREDGVTVGGDGNGFKMGPIVNDPFTGYENQHKRTMIRCIAFNNRVHGFVQNAAYAQLHFYNNAAFNNGTHGFVMNNPHDPQVVMIARNNISYKNKSGQAYFNDISFVDHNTFNYNNTPNPEYNITDADFISIDPTGTDGPRQPDGSLPNLPFLKLAAGSDLIERGVDVGLPFNGNYPDLGPFETSTVINVPNITTKTMTEVTKNSAVAGGNIVMDGGSPITAKGVCWSTSHTPTLANTHTDEGPGGGEFTSNLTGLTPDTQYYVRAYATNAAGTSYGEEVPFKTLKELFAPTVTTTAISTITENTAIGGGNVTFDGNTEVTARGICWSTSPNPTIADNNTIDAAGVGAFTSILEGLTPETVYYVRAYATNSVGTSYGEEVSFTTLKHLEVPVVTTAVVTDITETTAVSGGNVTFDGNTDVTARGICWSTSPNPTTADNIVYSGSGVGLFTSSLAGLSPNTTYYVRAFAINSVGTSYGEEVIFTTLKHLELPVVFTASITNITKDGATAGGNVTFDGFDNVVARGMVWDTSPDPTIGSNKTVDGNGTGVFSSSISGLNPNTKYYAKAYAENSVGVAYGDEKSFMTESDIVDYGLKIYPNPVPAGATEFRVEVTVPGFDSTRLYIYDILGKLRYTEKMDCWLVNWVEDHTRNEAIIYTRKAKLTPGIYIIKVTNKKKTLVTGKLIIL